jgi:hypothetical protein
MVEPGLLERIISPAILLAKTESRRLGEAALKHIHYKNLYDPLHTPSEAIAIRRILNREGLEGLV